MPYGDRLYQEYWAIISALTSKDIMPELPLNSEIMYEKYPKIKMNNISINGFFDSDLNLLKIYELLKPKSKPYSTDMKPLFMNWIKMLNGVLNEMNRVAEVY